MLAESYIKNGCYPERPSTILAPGVVLGQIRPGSCGQEQLLISVWKPVREMRGSPSFHHVPRGLWGPLLCLLATFILDTEAVVLSQCELAHALQEGGLDGYHDHSLAHWLCLAHHGSGLNTEAVFRLPDGSLGYGIFQIRGHKWCSPGEGLSENRCRMDCQGRSPLPQSPAAHPPTPSHPL
uniref:Lysozyme n=1 Tax=Ornithorhynchus anatinus TaxID=9258 RepID=A0A6I8N2P0_ORNAN